MNIVILDDYQDVVRKLICASKLEPYNAKVFTNTVNGLGQLSVRLKDADVIVLNRERTQLSRALIGKLPKLKLVAQTGRVGANVDVNACTELGIAVASATDVAKAAAGVVLTDPGLGGVLTVVRAGREVHRRMLTYTLNKTLKTFEITVFLTLGLWLTGEFVISPMLIVLLLFANDFVTMSIATDRVLPAPKPQRWAVRRLVGAAAVFAALSLLFSFSAYWWIRSTQDLSTQQMQTVVFLLLVFTNQACIYVLRTDGRLWSFAPGRWMALASAGDVTLVSLLAALGWLMAPVPPALVAGLLASCAVFALALDATKHLAFQRFAIV
ncbi:glycerate dehydrogenase [mine drainage metagenome]|uniref:Glycerate dehydrogenase n=1 Tax=mine drainage metagenome TaxID=410659 RepID=A0A1J5QS67_9ZZZZ